MLGAFEFLNAVCPEGPPKFSSSDSKVFNRTALKARESGIETVFQDRALCPQQSIVWNIFMGKELRHSFGFIRVKEQVEEANRIIREIGFTSK